MHEHQTFGSEAKTDVLFSGTPREEGPSSLRCLALHLIVLFGLAAVSAQEVMPNARASGSFTCTDHLGPDVHLEHSQLLHKLSSKPAAMRRATGRQFRELGQLR